MSEALQWVKLSCRLIHDDGFLDLSPEAKTVALLAMAKSGSDGGFGRDLSILPSRVARWSGLPDQAAGDAVQELIDAGYFVDITDEGVARIASWDDLQVTEDEYEQSRKQKSEAGRRGASARWGSSASSEIDPTTYIAPAIQAVTGTGNESAVRPERHEKSGVSAIRHTETEREENTTTAAPESARRIGHDLADALLHVLNEVSDAPPAAWRQVIGEAIVEAERIGKENQQRTSSRDLARYLRGVVGASATAWLWDPDLPDSDRRWAQGIVGLHGMRAIDAIVEAATFDPKHRKGYVINQTRGRR